MGSESFAVQGAFSSRKALGCRWCNARSISKKSSPLASSKPKRWPRPAEIGGFSRCHGTWILMGGIDILSQGWFVSPQKGEPLTLSRSVYKKWNSAGKNVMRYRSGPAGDTRWDSNSPLARNLKSQTSRKPMQGDGCGQSRQHGSPELMHRVAANLQIASFICCASKTKKPKDWDVERKKWGSNITLKTKTTP